MRNVLKDQSPPSFEEWKRQRNENWAPTYQDLRDPQKAELHDALLAEQGWTCCYCGCEIDRTDSHIEHFVPRHENSALAIDYQNLHASCLREITSTTPRHCGHSKGGELNQSQCISPLDPTCEARFIYQLDGSIQPSTANGNGAAYMIELLQLDIPFVRNRREAVLQLVFDPAFLQSVTKEELELLRVNARAKNTQGKISSFGHVISRFAEQRLTD